MDDLTTEEKQNIADGLDSLLNETARKRKEAQQDTLLQEFTTLARQTQRGSQEMKRLIEAYKKKGLDFGKISNWG